ncbi:hypothetical protein ACF1GT_26695 [Streptomyces sp. NPDC014636]
MTAASLLVNGEIFGRTECGPVPVSGRRGAEVPPLWLPPAGDVRALFT